MTRRIRAPHATPLMDVWLDSDKNVPSRARRDADSVIGDVDPETRYNFLLIVSELVSNAVLHSRGPLRLRVWREEAVLRTEVHDGSSLPPTVLMPSTCRPHGRGMFLVDSFADDWGFEATPTGKVVWAEVSTAPRADPESRSGREQVPTVPTSSRPGSGG
ncbi:ATP-binding protein [Saccharomonospora glauca]|uniref:Anti-sigma regulatory factor (Ser/Thr protein kinase) n=1 Tax=Saccharomonospora glauca K62 TaxID=928724 RepID=I1D658_9PSEU|nr:ATP-binding protein [Saccharomonospora glauca]EIF00433.1 anti-sigma regulatory factor (Ser/Thr protein kinase) [Saccharomonospora glauca K62]